MLKRLGVDGKAVLIDVAADEKLARSVRNIPGVSLVRERARHARATSSTPAASSRRRGALEKLQEALRS